MASKNRIKVKELVTHFCQQSLKRRNTAVSLCCDYIGGVKYDCEKSLKEEKRQERQTKGETEPVKDMLSFVLMACWRHLMNERL